MRGFSSPRPFLLAVALLAAANLAAAEESRSLQPKPAPPGKEHDFCFSNFRNVSQQRARNSNVATFIAARGAVALPC